MTRQPSSDLDPDPVAEPLAALEPPADTAAPQDPLVLRALAVDRRTHGDELGALAHLIAAQTLEAYASGSPTASVVDLCKVATGYFMQGDLVAAARWYRLALTLDPNVAIAYQNLAAIYSRTGHMAQAEACRERAYQIQRVFIESTGNPARRVLILCAGRTSGNVPFEALLPGHTHCRIKYAIDYATDEEDGHLPPYDLVFNAVGDPDIAVRLAGRLERFAKRCDRPLLNTPSAVARTQRQRLPVLLRDLDDVTVAPCIRFERAPESRAALLERLASGGIDWPVLARPAATHGGEGLVRCETIETLDDTVHLINGPHYLTGFCDYRSTDGYYRKYRIIFVDREPYPYHLAVSSHWMVHYFSAGMNDSSWKLDEEQGFLQDPRTALGPRAMAAVVGIGRRLDLDYGGVDFALLPGGQVLVFEANATMLVHRERKGGPLAHKNFHVQQIVDAFQQLLARRTST